MCEGPVAYLPMGRMFRYLKLVSRKCSWLTQIPTLGAFGSLGLKEDYYLFGTWSVRVAVAVLEYDVEVRGLHYVEYLCLRGWSNGYPLRRFLPSGYSSTIYGDVLELISALKDRSFFNGRETEWVYL